jgi:hypothetical protein
VPIITGITFVSLLLLLLLFTGATPTVLLHLAYAPRYIVI